jgi:hypothetical protein
MPEPFDVTLAQALADPGQRVGILDRAKPVIERLKGDPAALCSASRFSAHS